jgi:hypothetical protein
MDRATPKGVERDDPRLQILRLFIIAKRLAAVNR